MRKKMYNQCKLCLEDRELKNSHIYPKWAVKNCRDKVTSKFLTFPASNAQDGPKEYLLCEECEAKFGQREKYFRELILSRRVSKNSCVKFILIEKERIRITPFDFQQVKYFIMSILWRASVTSIRGWSISLDREEKEMLRQKLYTEAIFSAEFFPTKTDLLYIDGQNDSKIFVNPHKLHIEYGTIIAIIICGIIFYIHPVESNIMFTNFITLKQDSWTLRLQTPADLNWLNLNHLTVD